MKIVQGPSSALRPERSFSIGGANANCRSRRGGYVMLETVIATGMLIVGLAVIGAQLQESNHSVHRMRLKARAMMLAEMQLAQLDLGLVALDSIDEVQEGDFGPRYPDWGWVLITEPTAIDGLYRLTVEVLYLPREDEYREDTFDFEFAERMFTASAFRTPPRPLDLGADFGLNGDELDDFMNKVDQNGIPCFEGGVIDPTCLANVDIEDLLKILPVLKKLGIDVGDIESVIPSGLLQGLHDSGLLDEGEGEEGAP